MFDGSNLPIEENVKKSAEVVAIAHAVDVSVEAELGALAGGQFSNKEAGKEMYTEPCQASYFVEMTGSMLLRFPSAWCMECAKVHRELKSEY